jgi:hypothetical protein
VDGPFVQRDGPDGPSTQPSIPRRRPYSAEALLAGALLTWAGGVPVVGAAAPGAAPVRIAMIMAIKAAQLAMV